MNRTKKGWKFSILLYCCLQMSMLNITSIITHLAQVFPEYDISAIQLLSTFPNIVIVFVSIICGKIMDHIDKRKLIFISCMMFLFTAVGGYFLHQSYALLLLWSVTLGSAIGIMIPTAVAVINEETTGDEKTKMIGMQNSAIGIGGIIVVLFGGVLASIAWYYCYLSYLLIIPGFIGLIYTIGNKKREKSEKSPRFKMNWKITIYCSAIGFFFFSFYNAIPTNISLRLTEVGIDSAIKASLATSSLMLGSALAGIVFNSLYHTLGKNTLTLGLCLLSGGLVIISIFPDFIAILIGALIAGSSLSFVMATATMVILNESWEKNTSLSVAVTMAASDCGGFFSPVYTNISKYLFQSDLTFFRFGMIFIFVLLMIGILNRKKIIYKGRYHK